jgi:flagellar hook-associated protein 1 FlgK
MSLNVTLNTATSGMMAAQAGLRAVSDNIANVNTPGYVRKTVDQRPMVVNGVGMGVEVVGVTRVTDQYLQLASLSASSDSSRWDVFSQYLDNAQSLFGDPSSDTFFFNRLDQTFASFATAANDPSSSLQRSQSISNVQDFLAEAGRINGQIGELGRTVDGRVQSDVDRANDLLSQIDQLNVDISRAKVVDRDASGSENIQAQLVDQLATIMTIKLSPRQGGGVDIRSPDGVQLAGGGAAVLSYNRTDSTHGYISAKPASGSSAAFPIQIDGGEMRGLMDLRDEKLPEMSDQLGEFVTRAVDQLNAAHNASSSVPAPGSLTGRNTGLDLPTAVSGFTGKSTVAIVGADGVVQRKVQIDFDNMQLSVDGGAPSAFTAANFQTSLDTALSGFGDVNFNNGALSIAAQNGAGVAIDEGTSDKAGKAFSHFFGLNDLVRSNGYTNYDTGLKGTDTSGFTVGGKITLRIAQPDGKPIRDVTVTVPGGDMNALVASLNNSSTGVGLYGQFKLDADGALTFAGAAPTNATMSVVQDNTQRGVGGPSISELFGLGTAQRSARAGAYSVDQAIDSDPMRLALAKLDLSVAAGQPALRAGDGQGAMALANAGETATDFKAAGSLGDVTMTISRYASEFGGAIGRDAAAAETRKNSADAVQAEANTRRQGVEGVNLDEELVKMTTYQQAFNASARMIQASKDLFDVLTNMVG